MALPGSYWVEGELPEEEQEKLPALADAHLLHGRTRSGLTLRDAARRGDVSLRELQWALDVSIVGASPLAGKVFKRAEAAAVERAINRVMCATVATVRRDGRPHAAVVAAGCVRGTIYLAVSPGSVLLANVRRHSAVAVTVTSSHHDVMMQGEAVEVGRAQECEAILADLGSVSRRAQFMPATWNGYLYRVSIERIFFN